MILVGENGCGKTTILRILYETLACKWISLSTEEFYEIELEFSDNESLTILKSELEEAIKHYIDVDSATFRGLPSEVRRTLLERSDGSSTDISYDLIMDFLKDSHDSYRYLLDNWEDFQNGLEEKLFDIDNNTLGEYNRKIKGHLGCNIIYLPTYRRAEKRIDYANERDRRFRKLRYSHLKSTNNSTKSLEVAEAGMDDVKHYIDVCLKEIERKANLSASRLNYQCFKGILNKNNEEIVYDPELLTEDEIEKVFGSINEELLSPDESSQIQSHLQSMKLEKTLAPQTYEQIVYYFYSMLRERYLRIKENEKEILSYFEACNSYLVDKAFEYDEKDYSYSIFVVDENGRSKIDLEDLSSGEKQVVSIFSYLYLSPISKSIVLIDEPELSLSVPWQRRFLMDMFKGNKCLGLVAVTHSPFVFDNELKPLAHSLAEFIQ